MGVAEETEGVAGRDAYRSDCIEAAARGQGRGLPGLGFPGAEGDNPSWAVAGKVRWVVYFEPEFRKKPEVFNGQALDELLPFLEAIDRPLSRDLKVAGVH